MYEIAATPLHLLVNTGVTLTATFTSDGVAVDPGETTLGIADEAGNVIVAAGTATSTVPHGEEPEGTITGLRTYALDAQAELNRLTVTWTTEHLGVFSTPLEIVGAYLFTVAEARAFDNDALASAAQYTAAGIEAARARILDGFEQACGVAFVPRVRRVVLSHRGHGGLLLPSTRVRSIRRVETRDGTTWTVLSEGDLADLYVEPWGLVEREGAVWSRGTRNIRVTYEHGYDQPPPEIRRAALQLLRYEMVETDVPSRATSMAGEFGTFSLATAGRGTSIYGLPDVDAVLHRYSERVPGIA